jgi:hypothetical protein
VYGIAADLLVLVHVAYVAYVVVGQLVIMLAAPFHRAWARNPWFRFTHLLAIGIVALEAVMGWRCPLSVWEEQLRQAGGQSFDGSETFMGRILHKVLFIDGMPESFFTTLYLATLVIVVQGLLMYPPRWFRRRTRPNP